MWLVGAWVEYITYDAIDSHWSTSALPYACLIGVGLILVATAILELIQWIRHVKRINYEMPERVDYYMVGADIGAYAFYLLTGGAAWANFIAVSTTIITFIPIWRTTFRNGNEHPGPWFIWCIAYLLMFVAVLAEGGDHIFAQSFYPIYYLFLHAMVAFLSIQGIRVYLKSRLTDTRAL
jgi:hypothetical protein